MQPNARTTDRLARAWPEALSAVRAARALSPDKQHPKRYALRRNDGLYYGGLRWVRAGHSVYLFETHDAAGTYARARALRDVRTVAYCRRHAGR